MPSNINLSNTTNSDIFLSTSVAPELNMEYWGYGISTSDPGDTQQMLWMGRDDGITDGDTWIFTTSFTFDGVSVSLQEKLKGTSTSSDLYINIVAGSTSSGYQSDNTSVQFKGTDGTQYQVTGQFVPNGTFNDVLYTLLKY